MSLAVILTAQSVGRLQVGFAFQHDGVLGHAGPLCFPGALLLPVPVGGAGGAASVGRGRAAPKPVKLLFSAIGNFFPATS
jgi:hypothetical protein